MNNSRDNNTDSNFVCAFQRELCNMIVECCSQERTYIKFYGLLGERFCFIAKAYQEAFDECFATYVSTTVYCCRDLHFSSI